MRVPEPALTPTLMVIQGFGAFSAFAPPLHEIRRKSPSDAEFAADVRMGELAASGAVLGMGAAFSYLTSTPYPFVAALFVTGAFVALYECTLKGRPFSPLGMVSHDNTD